MSEEQHKMILDHFGEAAVMLKMAEECNELAAAICRMNIAEKNNDPKNHGEAYHEVLEEFADVLEVGERLKLFLNMESVNGIAEYKRQKTIKRIQKSKE
jgi:NTP pyrophosphatase (non-canonical NTP hydrolase)